MDGYIKNKRKEIAETRKTILYLFAIPTIIAVAYILVFLFGMYACQEPEDWRSAEIVFGSMSRERIGRGIHDAVNSQDGKMAFCACDKLTIAGIKGSAAEKYAQKNKIPFVAV